MFDSSINTHGANATFFSSFDYSDPPHVFLFSSVSHCHPRTISGVCFKSFNYLLTLTVWHNIFAFLYSTTETVLGHNTRVTKWSSPKGMVTKQILVGFKVLAFHRIKVTTQTIARMMCQTLYSTKVTAQTITEFCSPRQRTFLILLNCWVNEMAAQN